MHEALRLRAQRRVNLEAVALVFEPVGHSLDHEGLAAGQQQRQRVEQSGAQVVAIPRRWGLYRRMCPHAAPLQSNAVITLEKRCSNGSGSLRHSGHKVASGTRPRSTAPWSSESSCGK